MPTVPVYIRNSNKQFLIEEEPSELINKLLAQHYGNACENTADVKKGTHTTFKKERTKRDILKDIDEMKAEAQDKLEYCQDPVEAKKITEDYDKVIQGYWNEYKEADS